MLNAWRTWQDRDVVLALGGSQIVGYGTLYYAFAVLAPHVARDFGVAETTLFAIFSAGLAVGGVTAPRLGALLDRVGAARVMTLGSLAATVLVALLAMAPGIRTFGALVILIEAMGFAILYDASFTSLAQVARGEVRRAITALTLIAGFASTIFWPLTGWLAEVAGWRGTYLIFAAMHLCIAAPLHLLILRRRGPGQARPAPGPGEPVRPRWTPLPEAARRRAFWAVGASLSLTGVVIVAVGVHMIAILGFRDLGHAAYAVAMLMGPAQVLIRLVDAMMWRNRHPLGPALVSALALTAAPVAMLLPLPPLVAGLIFAVLFGTGGGLSSIVRGALPVALFGAEGIGAQLGRLAAIRNITGALAPFAWSAIAATAGPVAALWTLVVLGLAGAATLLPLAGPVRAAAAGVKPA